MQLTEMVAWLVREQSEMAMLFNGEAEAEAAGGCWVLALAKTFVGVDWWRPWEQEGG